MMDSDLDRRMEAIEIEERLRQSRAFDEELVRCGDILGGDGDPAVLEYDMTECDRLAGLRVPRYLVQRTHRRTGATRAVLGSAVRPLSRPAAERAVRHFTDAALGSPFRYEVVEVTT